MFFLSNTLFIKLLFVGFFVAGVNSLNSEAVIQKKTEETSSLSDVLFPKPKRQKTDTEQQDYWNSLLSLMFGTTTTQLSLVEDQNFQNFCSSLNPKVSLLFVSARTSLIFIHDICIVQDAKSS